ncbi:MAG: ribosome small subunit-dependent GTPase A [Cyclobacteriaceae bacterium]|nr:ribosome small subunit-dependent GTPase A [Cyclobacteriaceae bacterium]UYN86259.1 MAG: ribosome small subunit-dependent GTPase A [Cyclobacteriaceae bacterium]
MIGLVKRSTGSWYDVYLEDGRILACRTRGKLRLEGFKESNPVAVGDYVELDIENDGGVIYKILDRKNHILRQSVKKTGHAHVLAANIDQAVLVVTMILPRTSSGFIDRFLVTAEAYDIPQAIIFNKQDVLDHESLDLQNQLIETYTRIGVRCLKISALTDDLNEVQELLKNKTSLIAGHSGVGKSTLLNKLSPEINQTTSGISGFSEKGTHTTTFAEMFRINNQTFVIDTPGIKEWGLVNISGEELSDNFPEMRALRSECKYGYRCLHVNEPRCAIKHAVEEGEIATSRYANYLSMLSGEDNRK